MRHKANANNLIVQTADCVAFRAPTARLPCTWVLHVKSPFPGSCPAFLAQIIQPAAHSPYTVHQTACSSTLKPARLAPATRPPTLTFAGGALLR